MNAPGCLHYTQRMRVGPTSRKRDWSVLVDQCIRCGRTVRCVHDLTWRQYDWVRRWNVAVTKSTDN